WKVVTIDGHNVDEIRHALDEAIAEPQRPTLIIGKTIMAKGALRRGRAGEWVYSRHTSGSATHL
ncbi:MAG: hypothetical protein ACFNME_10395, partial [Actinomyces dentalis]